MGEKYIKIDTKRKAVGGECLDMDPREYGTMEAGYFDMEGHYEAHSRNADGYQTHAELDPRTQTLFLTQEYFRRIMPSIIGGIIAGATLYQIAFSANTGKISRRRQAEEVAAAKKEGMTPRHANGRTIFQKIGVSLANRFSKQPIISDEVWDSLDPKEPQKDDSGDYWDQYDDFEADPFGGDKPSGRDF